MRAEVYDQIIPSLASAITTSTSLNALVLRIEEHVSTASAVALLDAIRDSSSLVSVTQASGRAVIAVCIVSMCAG
jgi:hypothetical protein